MYKAEIPRGLSYFKNVYSRAMKYLGISSLPGSIDRKNLVYPFIEKIK